MPKPKLEMVFRGIYDYYHLPLPEVKWYGEIRPEFEAVWSFDCLELMQDDAYDFTYSQAFCVTKVEYYGFRNGDSASVLVHPDAVRWILCFPIVRRDEKYVPEANAIKPDDDDVFWTFSSAAKAAPDRPPVRAVPHMDNLSFLSPQHGDNLALVRASKWHWNKSRHTVSIRPQDIAEMELILDSEVHVF